MEMVAAEVGSQVEASGVVMATKGVAAAAVLAAAAAVVAAAEV